MYDLRKINIDPSNVKLFTENFGGTENLTRFVNSLIEKHFEGRVIKLQEDNYKVMKKLIEGSDKTICYVVNLCLSSAEFEMQKMEKPRIVISEKNIYTKKIAK